MTGVPSRAVISSIGDGDLEAVISAEVIQEILHRFLSLRRPEVGRFRRRRRWMFAPVLPITHALMRSVPDLAARYPTLAARDLVHVATCVYEGITDIISPDKGFDQVTEIRRIDPRDSPRRRPRVDLAVTTIKPAVELAARAAVAARTEALFRSLRRVPRGPLPAQERASRRRLRREVPRAVRSGRHQRAVRLLGCPGSRLDRRADGRPGRRAHDRWRHPRLRDRPSARAFARSSPRRSEPPTARPIGSSGAASTSSPGSASCLSTTS